MADAPSPLRALAQAAHAAREFRLSTEFDLPDDGRLAALLVCLQTPCMLCRRTPTLILKLEIAPRPAESGAAEPEDGNLLSQLLKAFSTSGEAGEIEDGVWEQCYQDCEMLSDGTPRLRDMIEGRRRAGAEIPDLLLVDQDESSASVVPRLEDVADALRRVATEHPGALLREASVAVKARGGPMTAAKLGPLAIRAWHEAFGRPVPGPEEIAARTKQRRLAQRAEGERLAAILRTGPDGVAEFNRLPRAERAKAILRRADLAGCRLDGVDFAGADLEGADLSGASLVGALFWGEPRPSRIRGIKAVGADLTGAKLFDARGGDADFSRAILSSASLGGGGYRRARFIGADLAAAYIAGSDLRGADFTDAILKGAYVAGAEFDEHTRWPRKYYLSVNLIWKGVAGADPRKSRERGKKKEGGSTTSTRTTKRRGGE